MNRERVKIAYILGKYPVYSENFIYRELIALQKLNAAPYIIALRKENGTGYGSRIDLLGERYFFPRLIPLTILLNLFWFCRRPVRYLRIIIMIFVQLKNYSISTVFKQFILLFSAAGFYHLIKREKIKYVHAHLSNGSSIALFCNLLADQSYSFTLHAFDDLYSNAIFLKEKVKHAKKVMCESRYNETYLKNAVAKEYHSKIITIYSGIKIYENYIQKKWNLPIRILSIGRLTAHKGFITLIESLKLLRERNAEFEAQIVGEGSQHNELIQTIDKNNLAENVFLIGAKSYNEIEKMYMSADIFVLPSQIQHNGERDGLPNVLIEAMSFKLPVISTYVSAIPELIEDKESGMLVPERNPAALFNAIFYLIQNEEEAGKIALRGYEIVKKHFNIANTSKELYDAIITSES